MARKELIPPEKWEGLKAALEEASGTRKPSPRRKEAITGKPGDVPAKTGKKDTPKPVDEKKKEKKEKKGKKDRKDKGRKKGKKAGKKKNARK